MDNIVRRKRTLWSEQTKYEAIKHFNDNPKSSQKEYIELFNKTQTPNTNPKLTKTTLNTWLSPDVRNDIIKRFEKSNEVNIK